MLFARSQRHIGGRGFVTSAAPSAETGRLLLIGGTVPQRSLWTSEMLALRTRTKPASASETQNHHLMLTCTACRCSGGHFEAVTHGAALQWAAICISFHVGDIRLMAFDWCDEY